MPSRRRRSNHCGDALTVRPLNPALWLGIPALACVVATVLFAVPARLFGLQLPEPVFPIATAFAWAVIRPSVLPPFVLLVLGLFLDLLWGGPLPLGLWPICLLAAYAAPVLFVQRSLSQARVRRLLWASYALVCALVVERRLGPGVAARRDRASIWSAVAWQYVATVLLFPVAFLLIQRYEGADVRFR